MNAGAGSAAHANARRLLREVGQQSLDHKLLLDPSLEAAPAWCEPELVIFDCDGVLVDSETISNRVLAEMLTAEGLPTTLTQSRRRYQGMLLADIRSQAEEELGRELPEDWLARYESERDGAFRRELAPVTGAVEAVQRVTAAGLEVCVASQGKLAKIALSLSLTGLDRLFPRTVRFSAYSVANGKPAPDVFLHAAASMSIAPAHCVVVEDTPSGVTAAVSAQMRAVGYAADSDEQALRDAGATEILHSLDQLPRLLDLG
jgi:HAD superfamily hydrolase (TIGR01509 family)